MKDHLATYGFRSRIHGGRLGTGYCYTHEECKKRINEPWFRFRNDKARDGYYNTQDHQTEERGSVDPVVDGSPISKFPNSKIPNNGVVPNGES